MYEIGVVGHFEKILYFMAAGFRIYPCTDTESAKEALRSAQKDNCAIIFITPEIAEKISGIISLYTDSAFPAVIILPLPEEDTGTSQLKAAVEKAVGADIIFKNTP